MFDSVNTRNLDQVYEFNLYQYFLHLVAPHFEGAMAEETAEVTRISSSLPLPEMNAVLQTDVSDNFDEVYEDTSQFFGDKSLPYTWYIGPNNRPSNLKELLEAEKMRYVGDDVLVGTDLDEVIRNISVPNSLFVEAVNSQEKLDKWVELYCTAKNIRGGAAELFKRLFSYDDIRSKASTLKKYVGWLNGEPVGTSTLVTYSGIAVVYNEAVLPKYREFGIEDAMNIVPLKKARTEGYKVGLVQTTIGGIKRFTRHGFKELFKFKKMVDVSSVRSRRRRRR